MKVFIVFAHPDKRSLQHSLLQVTIDLLVSNGHQVKVSDLYGMMWKSELDQTDFTEHKKDSRLRPLHTSIEAFKDNAYSQDIIDEREKVLWADLLIFHFPLWWYSFPAILKGWFDRVLVAPFATPTKPGGSPGLLVGKQAQLIITAAATEENFSSGGFLDDISLSLYPIQTRMFKFMGLAALEPIVGYNAEPDTPDCFESTSKKITERIVKLSEQWNDNTYVSYKIVFIL